METSPTREATTTAVVVVLASVLILGMMFGALVGTLSGYKSWHRAQQRADANNRVRVTAINIRTAQQQARVVAANDARVKALADQRLIAARGVRNAQDEIARTLTPLYVQFEAVQAQLAMAHSQNHSVIYVPAGTNGTPIITENGRP